MAAHLSRAPCDVTVHGAAMPSFPSPRPRRGVRVGEHLRPPQAETHKSSMWGRLSSHVAPPLNPAQSLASPKGFASPSSSSSPSPSPSPSPRRKQPQQAPQEEEGEQQLRDFLRGGEDVAAIMSQMAKLLEDIQGFEDREEVFAVEMAAAAAVAGRLEVLDRNFLLALDYMVQEANKIKDTKQVWLLQVLKQQVLYQLESRMPSQVEVVSMLVTTPEKDARYAILRRAVAAASVGANRVNQSGGASEEEAQPAGAAAAVPAGETVMIPEVVESDERDSLGDPAPAAKAGASEQGAKRQTAQGTKGQTARGQKSEELDEDEVLTARASAFWEEQLGVPKEEEEEDPRVKKRVPAATLPHIIAQADDLIAFMEEDLPVRDHRLLARLVLAREEARGMMSGGFLDPRNDVRGFQNLPEAEVRFISQLVGIHEAQAIRERLLEVLRGKAEGEFQETPKDASEAMPYGAPVRPGHLMDSITKVIAGMYKTGGSGVVVQQLERIRKEALEVLQEVGHS